MQQKLSKYIKMHSYRQPPIYNAMYNTQQQMEDIMNTASMTPDQKSALYSNQYHRLQAFQNQLQNQIQDSVHNQLTAFLSRVAKSANKTSTKRRNLPRYRHAYDAEREESDSDLSNQSRKQLHWYTNDTDAEDDGSDVTVQSKESEAEDLDEGTEENSDGDEGTEKNSNGDEGTEENERSSPMSHYLKPPRTAERPIKHWYT